MSNRALIFGRAAVGAAAIAMLVAPMGAQSSSTSSSSSQSSRAAAAADEQVTVTGCIQREADYRKSNDSGRGGVAGTGVGVGNEFVLTNAMLSTSAAKSSPSSSTPSTTGTSGTKGVAYELTGSGEGQASTFVGKRVEVTGKMKASDPAGGPTEKVPGSQDLKLQEFEVSSIRAATDAGSCTVTP